MKNLEIDGLKYEIIKNEKEGFDLEAFTEKFTDYFYTFDYILGDWSYGKLRLKGFNDKTNKNFKPINNIEKVDDYLTKYCAFGCKYFILKKINIS